MESKDAQKSDIRFKQRLSNFEKAYAQLELALQKDTSNDSILRAGLIKVFEFTFELAWKTMKDRLEFGGTVVSSPREVIKEAFQAGFITNGTLWIEALDSINILAHTYDDALSKKAEALIRDSFASMLKEVHGYLASLS